MWHGAGGLAIAALLSPMTKLLGTNMADAAPALYDDFQGSPYALRDGQVSPNGRWLCNYTGYGEVRTIITSTAAGQKALQEKPMASTRSSETHASLVTSTSKWRDLELTVKMRTRKQLRTGSPSNAWEAAWLMWRYIDAWHHYYFILKPNGIEIGKKDNNREAEEQVFLYTAGSPRLALDTWSTIKIRQVGNHIMVWRGAAKIADVTDNTMSLTLSGAGAIGLYNEDALVQFDNVYATAV